MKSSKSALGVIDLSDVEKNYPEYAKRLEGICSLLEPCELGVSVEVWDGGLGDATGAYDPGRRLIRLLEADMDDYGEMTLCHEYGHHLMEGGKSWSPSRGEFLYRIWKEDWWLAVKETETYKNLRTVKEYANYLSDPREIWARVYSQWVAVRSGSDVLLEQHRFARRKTFGLYTWSDEEFEAIALALG